MPDLRRCKRWSFSGTNGGKVLKVDTVEVEEDEYVETVKSRRHSASEIVVSLTMEGVAPKLGQLVTRQVLPLLAYMDILK
jgi:hypothetical protein